ncbi:MAG: response regulator [Mariniphaga sp.]
MESTIKLLHLEDNPSDAKLVQAALRKAHVQFDYYFVDNEQDYLNILETKHIDIILSDYHLPDYSGTEALFVAKTRYPHIPFVFISGTMGEDVAIESLLNGATDYVLKNKMERLVPAVHRAYNELQVQKARQVAENELMKLSRAVEQSPNSVIITDINGIMEYANSATSKLTGYTMEEIIGQNPRIFSSGEKTREEYTFLWNTILSGREWFGEFHNKKKNGELYWESASIAPLFSENGEITNFLGIKTDITESKKLTLELIKSKEHAEESDRLKSAFLANMSHEIRTPMNGILGFAELLKEPGLTGEEQQEYIRIIQKSGARMLNIINEIVDISKIEAGVVKLNLTETNINEQTEYIYTFFKPEVEGKGLKLQLKNTLPRKEAIIETDGEKLYAIFMNLVKNAIKYTVNGSIEIGYDVIVETQCIASLQFFVKDTGMGIPKDRQSAIFERFVQADIEDKKAQQGAGLGLTITKSYVEMLGGRIWVESEEGSGSTFYFTLPYTVHQNETSGVRIEKSNHETEVQIIAKIPGLKILIAEDDLTSGILINIIVGKLSREIIKVRSGQEAIAACREHPDIDLILMDIQMPAMGGYEATRQIRQFNKEVVIIAQTAFGLSGDKEKALAAGCTDYIAKPINKLLLLELIQKHCQKKS